MVEVVTTASNGDDDAKLARNWSRDLHVRIGADQGSQRPEWTPSSSRTPEPNVHGISEKSSVAAGEEEKKREKENDRA